MEYGKVGSIGGLFLAGYLGLTAATLLLGGTTIPMWFTGIVAGAAAVLILIGK